MNILFFSVPLCGCGRGDDSPYICAVQSAASESTTCSTAVARCCTCLPNCTKVEECQHITLTTTPTSDSSTSAVTTTPIPFHTPENTIAHRHSLSALRKQETCDQRSPSSAPPHFSGCCLKQLSRSTHVFHTTSAHCTCDHISHNPHVTIGTQSCEQLRKRWGPRLGEYLFQLPQTSAPAPSVPATTSPQKSRASPTAHPTQSQRTAAP